MTCKFCRVENKTPSCILKMKLKLYICLCTPMTCPQISPLKFHSTTLERQLFKMLCNNVPWIAQKFGNNFLSPDFPGAVPSLKLLKSSSLLKQYLL